MPSDAPKGPAKLRRKKKGKVGTKVDTSHINRNEHNEVQREAIHGDEVEYQIRKAFPFEWLEILSTLGALEPKTFLSDKIINNYLLTCWWALRFAPQAGPIYLGFSEVNDLSRDVLRGETQPVCFSDGIFRPLYSSVVPATANRQVCFFLHRNQSCMRTSTGGPMDHANHFFLVLFDYGTHTAYVFGTLDMSTKEIDVQCGLDSGWDHWLGPGLWTIIGQQLDWMADIGDPATVIVTTKNWHQVCQHIQRPERNTESAVLVRMVTTAGYIHLLSCGG